MAACCAGPLGAVRLLERPSWLTALPASSASAPSPPGASSSIVQLSART
jgi:hypothetical protein